MFTIQFNGHILEVEEGANLRKALLSKGLSPYSPGAEILNCRGLGTCGTCAVQVEGEVSKPTSIEAWRLQFPPHKPESGLRLACQCAVKGNLSLVKHKGFWGQHAPIAKK